MYVFIFAAAALNSVGLKFIKKISTNDDYKTKT